MTDKSQLATRLLNVIEHDIAPMTAREVKHGNKIFGAAILNKSDLSLVIAETNNEIENPLWHGEMHAIKKLYELDAADRPDPKECIFLATHEPCSLCLSAITWAGYDNFYYLFSHQESRDSFAIPHDLKILKQVFTLEPGAYNRQNEFWTAHSLTELVENMGPEQRRASHLQIEKINQIYTDLSVTYQTHKGGADIPLA